MHRFMIIVAVLICFAVSGEADCISVKKHWWNDPRYKCTMDVTLDCWKLKHERLHGSIEMYDEDDDSDDDHMGSRKFKNMDYPAYDYYGYKLGRETWPIRVYGYGTDWAGGNVEPYLKITHNCGGSNQVTYKYHEDWSNRASDRFKNYLRHDTDIWVDLS